MTYNVIFFAKQTKVIGSVYLFINRHYTQILHKQLVKDRLLDALLMIYNKSIYTYTARCAPGAPGIWSEVIREGGAGYQTGMWPLALSPRAHMA